ncbi:MAG TPA: ABC transporter permease [Actinotalea sp.]
MTTAPAAGLTARATSDAPAVRPVRPLPSLLALSIERTRIELRQYSRERDAVVFIFAYPIIMLAIFATVFGQDGATVGPEPGIPFGQYFLPGMVATGVLLSSFQNVAMSIAIARDEGALKRLRATPLPPAAYFLGKVGSVLISSFAQMGLLLVVARLVFGIDLPTTADRWLTFAWVLLLGTATGAVCGVAFSSVPRSGKSASAVVTPIVLVLQFISGVFFMFSSLPSWMQQVASLFPLKWMAQGMRSVFLPDTALAMEPAGSWEHGMTAAVLGAYLLVGLVLGVRTFRWRRRDDG